MLHFCWYSLLRSCIYRLLGFLATSGILGMRSLGHWRGLEDVDSDWARMVFHRRCSLTIKRYWVWSPISTTLLIEILEPYRLLNDMSVNCIKVTLDKSTLDKWLENTLTWSTAFTRISWEVCPASWSISWDTHTSPVSVLMLNRGCRSFRSKPSDSEYCSEAKSGPSASVATTWGTQETDKRLSEVYSFKQLQQLKRLWLRKQLQNC